MSKESTNSKQKKSPSNSILMIGAGIAILAAAGYYFLGDSSKDIDLGTTFIAQRGDLQISVLEGGNIEAQKSQEIRSEIKGHTGVKILTIVEEGYAVTQKDIDDGKILVELDSADLVDRRVNQEIATQSAEATYIERQAQFEIQMNQNQSNITAAELTAKFARMDFEKFLGGEQVDEILQQLKLEERLARADAKREAEKNAFKPEIIKNPGKNESGNRSGNGGQKRESFEGGSLSSKDSTTASKSTQSARGSGRGRGGGFSPEQFQQMLDANGGELPAPMREQLESRGVNVEDFIKKMKSGGMTENPKPVATPASSSDVPVMDVVMDAEYTRIRASIDFSKYANNEKLEDGEAKQMLRTLEDSYQTAKETYLLSQTTLDGQRRLAEKKFITQADLDLEELRVTQNLNRMESAETEKKLYIQYTFPMQVEQLLSDYEEALMDLQRNKKAAGAEMAQANARLKSAEQNYNLQKEKLADLIDQIDKSIIRAELTGMVVYGSSVDNSPWKRGNQEPIQEGTTVRERQLILVIPDMTQMGVKVNIHESAVQRVAIGQKAKLRIDAFPDIVLDGQVVKVAVLADSANAFMNPDLKVYPTVVTIEGTYDWLRPGMSAEVEVHIEKLEDVVYIPIQSVTFNGENQVCYILKNGKPESRIISTGAFTEEFIEIKSGLEGGEEVLLLAPDGIENLVEPSGENEDSDETIEAV